MNKAAKETSIPSARKAAGGPSPPPRKGASTPGGDDEGSRGREDPPPPDAELLVLLRVLFKYLERVDGAALYLAAKVLDDCERKHAAGESKYESLAAAVTERLRDAVGEAHWRQARRVQRQLAANHRARQRRSRLREGEEEGEEEEEQKPTSPATVEGAGGQREGGSSGGNDKASRSLPLRDEQEMLEGGKIPQSWLRPRLAAAVAAHDGGRAPVSRAAPAPILRREAPAPAGGAPNPIRKAVTFSSLPPSYAHIR